jgi:hypothetical protein
MDRSHRHLTARPIDFWLARGAILVIVVLQIGIVNDLAVGPHWLAPGLELALLVPPSAATAWTQRRARGASTDAQWASIGRHRRIVRRLALILTAICTLMNFGALARLIVAILGHAASGKTLLLDATNIWATNVVVFALWFWSLDRGGPAARGLISENKSDFLFTQQQAGVVERDQFKDWSPGFIDYLFLAFTNATAFSPTDTFPLTARAKFLMMTEATISLCSIAIVASRAVGILS